MNCPPNATCIEKYIPVWLQSSNHQWEYSMVPDCPSGWKELPYPLPNGEYVSVFEGVVNEKDAILTLRTADGKLFASLAYPDKRNWVCSEMVE